MELTMLGTGQATATNCYHTCFTLSDGQRHFLVDGGGGSEILRILQEERILLTAIHDVFVSHAHTDHILGIIWIIRMIGQQICSGQYEGDLRLYCHAELAETLTGICRMVLAEKITALFDSRIRFFPVEDGDVRTILDCPIRFFDIHSTKMKQFGFEYALPDGQRLIFCGDEPLTPSADHRAKGCHWLLHEAYCLYRDREQFRPYEKHHSTVKDACVMAESLGVQHLILYHTEDTQLSRRKALYTAEGAAHFSGILQIPDDRERIPL